jgi:O-antigen/teichoic acid export membrane protein
MTGFSKVISLLTHKIIAWPDVHLSIPAFKNLLAVQKKPIIKSIGIYASTNFLSKGVSFLLLFIFTNPKYITPSENGLLSLFNTSVLCLLPFVSAGALYSISTDFFKVGKKEFKNLFTTSFLIPIVVTIFSLISLYFLKQQLNTTYGFPSSFVWIIPAIVFLIFCNENLIKLIRNNNDPIRFLKVSIVKTCIEFGLSVILVVFFAWHWQGRVAGILASYIVAALYGFYYFFKMGYIFGNIKKKYIYSELIYAIPIIAMQGSIFFMNASDKFFLSAATNDHNETVGIYSIACIFASVIIVLSGSLLQYVFPKIYESLSYQDIDYTNIKKLLRMYLRVMFLGMLAIFIFTPIAYHFFINEKYHSAMKYVYLICGGYFLWSITYFYYSFLFYYKEKRRLLVLSLCCITCSLGFNFFFINRWGIAGAAAANISTYLVVLIVTLLFTKPYWKMLIMPTPGLLNRNIS